MYILTFSNIIFIFCVKLSQYGLILLQYLNNCYYPDNRSFPWHAKNGEKRKPSEDIVSKSCWAWRNITSEWCWSPIFDKAVNVLASRYAHSSCARMTRGAKTGYTTSLTSVTSPNSWTTYRAYLTGFWHDFFRGFSFLSIFREPGKNLCYQGKLLRQTDRKDRSKEATKDCCLDCADRQSIFNISKFFRMIQKLIVVFVSGSHPKCDPCRRSGDRNNV